MLRFIYAQDLRQSPDLASGMFRDRADQFHTRLGWPVTVDAQGEERDQYDALNPLYVIWQTPEGQHGGSMRFLPTTGPVMVNEVFSHLNGGAPILSPLIWECTRFCLARGADPRVAAALMLGGAEIMHGFGIRHFVGVFDRRMERVYSAIGSSPDILGSQGTGRDKISVGLWAFCPQSEARLQERAELPAPRVRSWFDAAFGVPMRTQIPIPA